MLLAGAAVLAGAAAGSATGFGFALVAGPALFAALEPYEAVTALSALGMALSLLVLADGGPGRVRRRALVPMLLAALPGLGLGLLVLELLPKAGLQLAVGVAVLIAGLLQARRRPPGPEAAGPEAAGPEADRPEPLGPACAVGLASGTLTTSIGVSGPPIVLWLEAKGVGPEEFRASLAASFLALNFAGGAALLAAGGTGRAVEAGALVPLLGLVVVGHVAGALAFRRFDGPSFRTAVLALVIAAGLASAAAGIAGL